MNRNLSVRRRALALLLALVMALGLLPGGALAEEASSGHWADGYLSQMAEWGFIRADQAQNPDRALTRADFMSIVNRAYGYHELGETPFEDVSEYDWFHDDVGIAYTARYINGTSPTTASPNDTLNRETAATILGRNMMLQESAGEILDFSDARNISNWARGTIKSSMEHYLVNGYDDGTFRPQKAMSWGEIAALVTRTIGTPLQDEGDYSLGGVFGNVTVTSPGVTLRDTVISGDLYITGGVGLGGIKLENVTVLGRIIASGTGASEGGASILMRNVTADELLVDNLQDNEVSIRADGITEIGKTTVRTSAYIEDNTPEGLGLHAISLEGEFYGEDEEPPEGWEPPRLTLAGRIEEVVNRTPNSTIHAAKGTVAKLTVDEMAEGSHVVIDRGTVVKDLILDTGVDVTGEGDVTRLEVNAPGSTVEMLPDQIVIRPGITAEIAGEEMDSASAEEFLLEPMILSGYPKAKNVAPTSLEAVFSTNKKGTIHWAVSAITDGSVGADDLLEPPAYGSIAVRYGTLVSPRGNEETVAQITGLQPNGSYYLSAILEDAKGQASPVKVISFTTPDNTVPAFNTGYPHMSSTSPKSSLVVVSPNKDCKLYYALMPAGATAPTEDELKTSAVSGALGYGVRDVQKNIEDTFQVNDQTLEDTTNYVLYLWLVDANGANKSAIISLPFTTDDETPPKFNMDATVNKIQETSVSLDFQLNEDGTVYWVAVPTNTKYPKPKPGTVGETAPLDDPYAILQVVSGMNIGTDGKSGQVKAVKDKNGTINVTGLKKETSYDFYYIGKDNAGPNKNYSVGGVKKITINTLDKGGPIFTQRFSKVGSTPNDAVVTVKSDTDIYLDVNENIRYPGDGGGRSFRELYQDVVDAEKKNKPEDARKAREILASNLYQTIKIHKRDIQGNSTTTPLGKVTAGDDFSDTKYAQYVIDYTQATVTDREGGIRITFPTAGLHLQNGASYYFTITELTDTSNDQNKLQPEIVDHVGNNKPTVDAGHVVPPFTVEFATVDFDKIDPASDPVVREGGPSGTLTEETDADKRFIKPDMTFRVKPNSTETVPANTKYDILLWSADYMQYDLYYRVVNASDGLVPVKEKSDKSGYEYTVDKTLLLPYNGAVDQEKDNTRTVDENGWMLLGDSTILSGGEGRPNWSGRSVNKDFNGCGAARAFPELSNLSQDLIYEFAVYLTYFDEGYDRTVWGGTADMYVNVIAGQGSVLNDLAGALTIRSMDEKVKDGLTGGADSIGRWPDDTGKLDGKTLWIYHSFTDMRTPPFTNDTPIFDTASTSVTIHHNLESEATVYYVIAKAKSGDSDDSTPPFPTTRKKIKDGPNADESSGKTIVPVSGKPDEMWVTLGGPNPPPRSGQLNIDPMPEWMKGGTGEIDNPDQDNLVTNPTWTMIMQQDKLPSTVAGKGSFKSNQSITVPEVVSGLTPNTDYYAYFVIKGALNKSSHVYIYHFKTNPPENPKITMNNNPSVNGANLETHIESKLDYLVFTLQDAMNEVAILKQPFDCPFPDSYQVYATGEPDANGKKTFTVLDALLQAYSVEDARGSTNIGTGEGQVTLPKDENNKDDVFDGYSIFDMFATNSMKSNMSRFLRKGTSSTDYLQSSKYVVNDGSVALKAGVAKEETLNRVTAGTDYVILAVARVPKPNSTKDYEIDSYAAKAPINTSAVGAPETGKGKGAWSVSGKPTTTGFDGTIAITFDKLVYSDNRRTPLDAGALLANGIWSPPDEAADALTKRITPSVMDNGSRTTIRFTPKPGRTWLDTDSISFPQGTFFNVNGVSQDDKALAINISREGRGTANETVVVTITWGSESVPYRFPLSNGGSTLTIELVGSPIPLGGNYRDGYTLDLDASDSSKQSTKITVKVTPSTEQYDYRWSVVEASAEDVIQISNDRAETTTITGLKLGTATLRVVVIEKDGTTSPPKLVTVTVSGGITLNDSVDGKATADNTKNLITWDITGQTNPSVMLRFTTSPEVGNVAPILECDSRSIKVGTPRVVESTGGQSIVEASVQFLGSSTGASNVYDMELTVGGAKKKFSLSITGSQTNLIFSNTTNPNT